MAFFKSYTDALANLPDGKKTPLKRLEPSGSQATGSQASASQASATPRHQAKEQVAIEDAKDKHKLLIKAGEAFRANDGTSRPSR